MTHNQKMTLNFGQKMTSHGVSKKMIETLTKNDKKRGGYGVTFLQKRVPNFDVINCSEKCQKMIKKWGQKMTKNAKNTKMTKFLE
jgi:hypothetical protein